MYVTYINVEKRLERVYICMYALNAREVRVWWWYTYIRSMYVWCCLLGTVDMFLSYLLFCYLLFSGDVLLVLWRR